MDKCDRINTILDVANFDACASYLWGCKGNQRGGFAISKGELAKELFSRECHRRSWNECLFRIGLDFRIDQLATELFDGVNGLITESPEPKVLFENYTTWKRLTLMCGQDLFVAAQNPNALSVGWPQIISGDSETLHDGLGEGVAENHCHFSCLAPAFNINWFYLHNSRGFLALSTMSRQCKKGHFFDYYTQKDYWTLFNSALICVYLRRVLFYASKGWRTSDIQCSIPSFEWLSESRACLREKIREAVEQMPCMASNPSKHPFCDYANPNQGEEPTNGERKLLLDVLKQYDSLPGKVKVLFYCYLILKRYIAGFFIQNNGYYGFHNFERYERLSNLFIPNDPKVKEQQYQYAFRSLIEDQHISSCEFRIAPNTDSEAIQEKVRLISNACNNQKSIRARPSLCVVLHFIKQSRKRSPAENQTSFVLPRSNELLLDYQKQADAILSLQKKKALRRKGLIPIVGIDAANEEIMCRPEVFAPFYRQLRQIPSENPLHFTFHAGEDFLTLCDGLRAIYEAIIFLELGNKERIGHASALGTNPEKYFRLKGRTIIQTRQDQLDDYCFLYVMCKEAKRNDLAKAFKIRAQEALKEIYATTDFEAYLDSVTLRSDHPSIYRRVFSPEELSDSLSNKRMQRRGHFVNEEEKARNARKNPEALRIIHNYHFGKTARSKGDEIIRFKIDDSYLKAIKIAQERLAIIIEEKDLCVETNPTSNYLIGPYVEFEDIPTIRMLGLEKDTAFYKAIPLSIGTDDPSLFFTNLTNEYASIAHYLQYERNDSKEEIKEQLRKLARTSRNFAFN